MKLLGFSVCSSKKTICLLLPLLSFFTLFYSNYSLLSSIWALVDLFNTRAVNNSSNNVQIPIIQFFSFHIAHCEKITTSTCIISDSLRIRICFISHHGYVWLAVVVWFIITLLRGGGGGGGLEQFFLNLLSKKEASWLG